MKCLQQFLKTFNKGKDDSLVEPSESALYEFVSCVVWSMTDLSRLDAVETQSENCARTCCVKGPCPPPQMLWIFFAWEHVIPPMTARTIGNVLPSLNFTAIKIFWNIEICYIITCWYFEQRESMTMFIIWNLFGFLGRPDMTNWARKMVSNALFCHQK